MPYGGKPLVGDNRPHRETTITKTPRKSVPMARPEDAGKRLYTGSNQGATPRYPGGTIKIVKGR
jgi:hypothetical protein